MPRSRTGTERRPSKPRADGWIAKVVNGKIVGRTPLEIIGGKIETRRYSLAELDSLPLVMDDEKAEKIRTARQALSELETWLGRFRHYPELTGAARDVKRAIRSAKRHAKPRDHI